ncbi:hypothetical protein Taro_044643 [Colocasia esculenta]|uniref:Uncharacterized protein n=1 Tax=Colocasia esculenta TaxID=4460 RepID=A0A843X328_COLES|nr:hypothetical protein [Colocasia esculenta]
MRHSNGCNPPAARSQTLQTHALIPTVTTRPLGPQLGTSKFVSPPTDQKTRKGEVQVRSRNGIGPAAVDLELAARCGR